MTRTWGDPVGRHYIPKGIAVTPPLQVRLWAALSRLAAGKREVTR